MNQVCEKARELKKTKSEHVSLNMYPRVCVGVCVFCWRSSSSLPDFDDAVSGRGDDEALCGLKGGNVSDDVMVSHGEGFWAAAR